MVRKLAPREIPTMTGDEMKRLFGLRVQALRRQRGLTQEQLAEAIDRSVDTISNIERGSSSTRLETALSIAEAVGVSLAELFEFTDGVGDEDRERRRAVERIIEMVAKADDLTRQAMGEMIRIMLSLRVRDGADRP